MSRIQDLVQPYFLRRTKEAVLNLPPLTEVIVPVSMSLLQKEVYKSVIHKNYEALAGIYDATKAKYARKANKGKMYATVVALFNRLLMCVYEQSQRAYGAPKDTLSSVPGGRRSRA